MRPHLRKSMFCDQEDAMNKKDNQMAYKLSHVKCHILFPTQAMLTKPDQNVN